MFRRWLGVGLGAFGGAAVGAELAFLLINRRQAVLAQDSEGNLVVNNANVYWSIITLAGFSGLLLGSYVGMKLTTGRLTNEARSKAAAVGEAVLDILNPDRELSNCAPYVATGQEDEDMELQEPLLFTDSELSPISVTASSDLVLSPYVVAGQEDSDTGLQESLLFTDSELIPISVTESSDLVLPVVDLEAGLPAGKQSERDFHLDLQETYFSPSRQAQGGHAAFFPAASNSASKVLQIPAAQTADELEEDGWVLDLAM